MFCLYPASPLVGRTFRLDVNKTFPQPCRWPCNINIRYKLNREYFQLHETQIGRDEYRFPTDPLHADGAQDAQVLQGRRELGRGQGLPGQVQGCQWHRRTLPCSLLVRVPNMSITLLGIARLYTPVMSATSFCLHWVESLAHPVIRGIVGNLLYTLNLQTCLPLSLAQL